MRSGPLCRCMYTPTETRIADLRIHFFASPWFVSAVVSSRASTGRAGYRIVSYMTSVAELKEETVGTSATRVQHTLHGPTWRSPACGGQPSLVLAASTHRTPSRPFGFLFSARCYGFLVEGIPNRVDGT